MTTHTQNNDISPLWVTGNLQLAGILDSRIIELLKAINQSGSLNQAAKQVGLSYKGAWQIIERANNSSPKTLVTTAIGGTKGGGTVLTDAGHALIRLFDELQSAHQLFLKQLNQNLATNPDTVLLFQRLVVKTSARNQLFGTVISILLGSVSAEITIKLKGNEQIITTISLSDAQELGLTLNSDVLLLLNSSEIMLATIDNPKQFSARNYLACQVIQIEQDLIYAEVTLLFAGGEMLIATITKQSLHDLGLEKGMRVFAVFKTNAPILGTKSCL
ncbi:MAG: TOBE domain-containing protein [Methylococcaceae bacterium]